MSWLNLSAQRRLSFPIDRRDVGAESRAIVEIISARYDASCFTSLETFLDISFRPLRSLNNRVGNVEGKNKKKKKKRKERKEKKS